MVEKDTDIQGSGALGFDMLAAADDFVTIVFAFVAARAGGFGGSIKA